MSLAENLLNSLDETAYQNTRIGGIVPEEHIKVGQDRVITVPNSLKTIAVKGDKDIETATIDCVRYWDGHDLSTFAIYLNYILPNGDEGTYIPEGISKAEDTFSFDWLIGSEFTYAQGKMTFWIVAKLTDDSGTLIKQWSSFQNSDCTIAQGGDKIYVPEKQTDQDVISQAISISRSSAEIAEQQANLAQQAAGKAASDAKSAAEEEVTRLVGELGVVQETGISPTSVISQAGATRSFAHALNGEESGGAVLCEEVSPVLHPVVVGVRSSNLFNEGVFQNMVDTQYATIEGDYYKIPNGEENLTIGQTFLPNTRYTLSYNGRSTGNGRLRISYTDGAFAEQGLNEDTDTDVVLISDPAKTIENVQRTFGSTGYIYIKRNATLLNIGAEPIPYIPHVPDGTAVKVTSAGANLWSDGDIVSTEYNYNLANLLNIIKPNEHYTFTWKYSSDATEGLQNAIVIYSESGPLTINSGVPFTITESQKSTVQGVYAYFGSNVTRGTMTEMMLNIGSIALPFKPYKAGQSIDTTVGSTIDLESIAPYMSVYPDTEGTAVDVTYVKDTNAVIQKLVNAIVALGGNV